MTHTAGASIKSQILTHGIPEWIGCDDAKIIYIYILTHT